LRRVESGNAVDRSGMPALGIGMSVWLIVALMALGPCALTGVASAPLAGAFAKPRGRPADPR
jgi:hypothetical protein